MHDHDASAISPPEPDKGNPPDQTPDGDPQRETPRVPWHDPGPPVRKVNLPPDSPSPGVPIKPENPMIS